MNPLLQFGPLTLPAYGLLLAAALLAGGSVAVLRARRFGIPPARMIDLVVYSVFAALLGARLAGLIVSYDFERDFLPQLLEVGRSGGVFLGGFVSALIVFGWYTRSRGLPMWSVFDAAAPGIAVAQVFGRTGCLMAGCCYGRPTDAPWAIIFTDPVAGAMMQTPLGVPLHPTQIYEAAATLGIAIVLVALEDRGRYFPGRTFWSYVLLYGTARLVIEFFRGDERGEVFGVVSTAQAMAVVLVPLSLGMLWSLRRAAGSENERGRQSAALSTPLH